MANFIPGEWVTWLREERGGYGYITPVRAQIIRTTAKRVRIRALRRDGSWAERAVRPEHLKAAGGPDASGA